MKHTFKSEGLSKTKLTLIIAISALFATLFTFLALRYFMADDAWLMSLEGFGLIYGLFLSLSALFFILDHHNYKDLSITMASGQIHFHKLNHDPIAFDIMKVKKYSVVRTFYGWFGYIKFNLHISNRDKTHTQGILTKKDFEYDIIEALKAHKKEAIKENRV